MNKNKYKILLSKKSPNVVKKEDFIVYIYTKNNIDPSNLIINEFTFYFNDKKISGSIYLALESKKSKNPYIVLSQIDDSSEILKRPFNMDNINDDIVYTMLPSMQDYRSLIAEVGLDEAKRFLKSINDVAFFNSKTLRKNYSLKYFIDSDIFAMGFMRSSESFFTYHNANTLFKGLDKEELHKISSTFNLLFQLSGFNNSHEFNFEFDSEALLPKRVNIMIGKNGTGKSQALKNIVNSLVDQKNNSSIFKDILQKNERPLINRLLVIASDQNAIFPSERISNPLIPYKFITLEKGDRTNNDYSFGNSLIKLLRSKDSIKGMRRFDIFIKVIQKCIPVEKLVFRFNSRDTSKDDSYLSLSDLLNNSKNELVFLRSLNMLTGFVNPQLKIEEKLYPLSSGQRNFLLFAMYVSLFIENGSMVLIDEPETHLHPNLISDFFEMLDVMLATTGSLAIIATHSAYLVREVPRKQVHILKFNGQNIDVISPRLKTFGADVGAISQFIFEEEIEKRFTYDLYIKFKNNNYSFDDVLRKHSSELSDESLIKLKRLMELNEKIESSID